MTTNLGPRDVRIIVAPTQFSDWTGVLRLLQDAYAFMEERIDPPSSLLSMDADALEQKARDETIILAVEEARPIGCVFAQVRSDCVYVGKLAVEESARGRGLARRMIDAAETLARERALPFLELETRIELTENHETFGALGFHKVGESAHAGYDRPTSITMRRPVSG